MGFPVNRPRRLRRNETMRRLVRENHLRVEDLVYPLFVTQGQGFRKEIESMPGVAQLSVGLAVEEAQKAAELGIPAVILFGIPAYKDETGSSAWAEDEAVQRAVREIKKTVPQLLVITDVCLCEYTSHGHCGLLQGQEVANDPTLELLARTALSHARAGADIVAPSDMMDGRVAAIRTMLDHHGYQDVAIMSYAVKYASAYYGPFREVAESAPQFGDRKAYQMDPANSREALKEVALDLEEGADIVMVKPALAYMDIIRQVKDAVVVPVAAYNVSGEYAMIKAAARLGWIDEKRIVLETMLGFKRAGADIILTYHALDVAKWLKEGY
ncbi:porphobilinogen synthase [Carboxydocella sp. ULO1]|uniref:porphobilinogen synthase n=1 Tax=Carboxydocella sp. ULO1 TaxID=1926599 RepID=UPI0009AD4F96|nr:porphobilinogen synthase [Carboxydocella sp. ULO1]GAW29976.1 delta-aminolevulinic acid dehydratase [Carboxydocella sp. ULO1]